MKTDEYNLDNNKKIEETSQQGTHENFSPNKHKVNLRSEDYLNSYNEVSNLIRHNNDALKRIPLKYAFLVPWQEKE